MKLHNEINCTTLVQCDTVCKGLKNMLSTKRNGSSERLKVEMELLSTAATTSVSEGVESSLEWISIVFGNLLSV